MRSVALSIVLATTNAGKVREVRRLLDGWMASPEVGLELLDLRQVGLPAVPVEEDSDTFVGNALKKALQVSAETGRAALADDSGLEVDALGGQPGVLSARFAGSGATDHDNNQRLVELLAAIPGAPRTARFRAVVCLALDPHEATGASLLQRAGLDAAHALEGMPGEAGQWGWVALAEGQEGERMSGRRLVVWAEGTLEGRIELTARGDQGFGYDPHFLVPSKGATLAQMTLEEKNELSHRAQALRQMLSFFERKGA